MKNDEEHDKILDIFTDNFSDITSESERSEKHNRDSDESDIFIPSKRRKKVISSDSESENFYNASHDFECNLRLLVEMMIGQKKTFNLFWKIWR